MIGVIADLATISIFLVVALLIVVQLFVFEGGFRLGRLAAQRRARKPESVGIVVGSMLTLMAFVVGITLSIAMGRFAERRAGTLTEANAIGTAWLRTQAISDLRAAEIAQLLERHAQSRWDFVKAAADEPLLDRINRDTAALQTQIWSRMTALAKDRPDPIVASLMVALNETFDAATAMRFGLGFPLPQQLHRMLSAMTLLATAALGFQLGIRGNRLIVLTMLMITMWSVVVVYIYDIAAARVGDLRTTTSAYEWTLQDMRGDSARQLPALMPR